MLDKSLFEAQRFVEIILCLNYDGLYGINKINCFQSNDPNPAATWRACTYKVGDPVLLIETKRFWPVIYNDLEGRIVDIALVPGHIQFDVEVNRPLTDWDVADRDLEWVEGSTLRFSVYDYNTSDEPMTRLTPLCPSKSPTPSRSRRRSIFYTAVTWAQKSLKIFWTPET